MLVRGLAPRKSGVNRELWPPLLWLISVDSCFPPGYSWSSLERRSIVVTRWMCRAWGTFLLSCLRCDSRHDVNQLMVGNTVTHRQVEVLCLLSCGLTSSEAADQLSVSEHTIVRHISNMMSNFGAKNRLELLALAVAFGVIDTAHWPFRPSEKLVIHATPTKLPAALVGPARVPEPWIMT